MPVEIVVNTGPLIALALGCQTWDVLSDCGAQISVPLTVLDELQAGAVGSPGRDLRLPKDIIVRPRIPIPVQLSILS